MQSTYMAKPAEIKRKWLLIDAEAKPLAAWRVKSLFCGKHKPIYPM